MKWPVRPLLLMITLILLSMIPSQSDADTLRTRPAKIRGTPYSVKNISQSRLRTRVRVIQSTNIYQR